MSNEYETRKLLKIRTDLEGKLAQLQSEIGYIKKAIVEIDGLLVSGSFRQPLPVKSKDISVEEPEEDFSVKTKDGETLGSLIIDERKMVFKPREDLKFEVTIPPFQSFFIERVLDNMKSADEEKLTAQDISFEEVLSYEVDTVGDTIIELVIINYGGERRLREIQSSLRWTFEKMYEKLILN